MEARKLKLERFWHFSPLLMCTDPLDAMRETASTYAPKLAPVVHSAQCNSIILP